MAFRWKTPAEETVASIADRVEVLVMRERTIVPAEGWPVHFWEHVERRVPVPQADTARIVSLYCGLEPGMSARCHLPPWGIAFYRGDDLLLTATLCFRCSNVYVYTEEGMDLRAFDVGRPTAKALRKHLEQMARRRE